MPFSAITLLKDKPPGSFVIRNSSTFQGAYGLAVRVAQLPPNVQAKTHGITASSIIYNSYSCESLSFSLLITCSLYLTDSCKEHQTFHVHWFSWFLVWVDLNDANGGSQNMVCVLVIGKKHYYYYALVQKGRLGICIVICCQTLSLLCTGTVYSGAPCTHSILECVESWEQH